MNVKVSVIIPVYNASKYIKKMAECLLSQTLRELEFIFVDDCSTDESVDILYELEKKDPARVMVIKLDENLGPGGARNIGMQYASGEYIAFADSDDMIKDNMYEALYKKAKENDYDIVECGYYSERKHKDMMLWSKKLDGNVDFDKRVKMILSCGFLWSKLYKRSFLINSQIQFIEKIPFEDVDFLTRLYLRADKIGIVDKSLYYYRDNKESFSRKRNKQGFLEINNKFSEEYLNNMKKEKLYDIFKPIIEYVVIDVWFDLFKGYINLNKNINRNELELLVSQLKNHVSDYEKNIFLVEKARKSSLHNIFSICSYDINKAMNLL